MEGDLTLAMEAVAASGVVVPSEQRAALGRSLLLKQQEARLSALAFWGRLLTSTGRDYLLARGCNSISPSSLLFDTHYYYSQDGMKWMDLQALTDEMFEACKTIRGYFTGEPSHIYSVKVVAPSSQNEQDVSVANEKPGGAGNPYERQLETTKEGADQEEVEIRQDDDEDAEESKEEDHSQMGASKSGLALGLWKLESLTGCRL